MLEPTYLSIMGSLIRGTDFSTFRLSGIHTIPCCNCFFAQPPHFQSLLPQIVRNEGENDVLSLHTLPDTIATPGHTQPWLLPRQSDGSAFGVSALCCQTQVWHAPSHTCPRVEIHNSEDDLVAVQRIQFVLHAIGLPSPSCPNKQHWPPMFHVQIHQIRQTN